MANAGVWGPQAITDARGNAQVGAKAYVYELGTNTLATLYTDRAKSTTADNPTDVDDNGNLRFFADPSMYRVEIYRDGIKRHEFEAPAHYDPEGPADQHRAQHEPGGSDDLSGAYQERRVVDLTQSHDLTDGGELADAFASAMANEPAGGLVILIPAGTYTATVKDRGDTEWSACKFTRDDVLVMLDPDATINIARNGQTNYAGFYAEDLSNIEIVGTGTVNGDRASHSSGDAEQGHSILFRGVDGWLIDGPFLQDAWGDNIYLGNSSSASGDRALGCLDGHVTERTICHNSNRSGISVVGMIGGSIAGTFRNAGKIGMNAEPNTGTRVRRVAFDGIHAHDNDGGVRFEGGGDTTLIEDVTIGEIRTHHNAFRGLAVRAVGRPFVAGPVHAWANSQDTDDASENVQVWTCEDATIANGSIRARIGSETNGPSHGLVVDGGSTNTKLGAVDVVGGGKTSDLTLNDPVTPIDTIFPVQRLAWLDAGSFIPGDTGSTRDVFRFYVSAIYMDGPTDGVTEAVATRKTEPQPNRVRWRVWIGKNNATTGSVVVEVTVGRLQKGVNPGGNTDTQVEETIDMGQITADEADYFDLSVAHRYETEETRFVRVRRRRVDANDDFADPLVMLGVELVPA